MDDRSIIRNLSKVILSFHQQRTSTKRTKHNGTDWPQFHSKMHKMLCIKYFFQL